MGRSLNDCSKDYYEWQTDPFAYSAGTAGGTVTLTGEKRVNEIVAYADGSNGTVAINGGDSITVRAGTSFTLSPKGCLVNPTIVFSASLDYFVGWREGA